MVNPPNVKDGIPSFEVVPMDDQRPLQQIARFCGQCNCGCPELFVDHEADDDRRIVITDDFGQHIQMSMEQLHTLVGEIKGGVADHLFATA